MSLSIFSPNELVWAEKVRLSLENLALKDQLERARELAQQLNVSATIARAHSCVAISYELLETLE